MMNCEWPSALVIVLRPSTYSALFELFYVPGLLILGSGSRRDSFQISAHKQDNIVDWRVDTFLFQ